MVLTATRRRIFLGITVFIYSSWTAGELGIGGTSWGHGSRGLLQLRIVSLACSCRLCESRAEGARPRQAMDDLLMR